MNKPQQPQITVHIATVSHRHGTDAFVALTEDGLFKELAKYCREWWGEEIGRELKRPRSNRELVDAYFGWEIEHGQEFIDFLGSRTL